MVGLESSAFVGLVIFNCNFNSPGACLTATTCALNGAIVPCASVVEVGGPSFTTTSSNGNMCGTCTETFLPAGSGSKYSQIRASLLAPICGYHRPPLFQSEIGPAKKCPSGPLLANSFSLDCASTIATCE